MTTAPSTFLADRLTGIAQRVAQASADVGRPVRILLATKTQPAPLIAEAVRAGFPLIGENRVQEVVEKAGELARLLPGTPLERHFIGQLQSNKINALLPLVDCVQSVSGAEAARRLATRAGALDRRLDVLVQVNVSGEPTKAGVSPAQAVDLATTVLALPELRLRGLMTVGLNSPQVSAVRAGYRLLADLRDQVRALPGGDTATELSMGMSADFEAAIAEGATIVRIGSAAFGARPAAR